jgi:hypothetical protein
MIFSDRLDQHKVSHARKEIAVVMRCEGTRHSGPQVTQVRKAMMGEDDKGTLFSIRKHA